MRRPTSNSLSSLVLVLFSLLLAGTFLIAAGPMSFTEALVVVRPIHSSRGLPTFTRSTSTRTSTRRFASINTNNENKNNNSDQDNINDALTNVYKTINKTLQRDDKHILESRTFIATPISAAVASFFLYPTTALWFHNAVNALSNNNWEPVDGGQLQWSILLPALNGVVMTAVSLLYANMISTTGTALRNRQITVHSSLSTEVEGLRAFIQLIPYYPTKEARQQFASYIQGYLAVLVQETDSEKQDLEALRSNSLPLSQYRNGLHTLSTTTSTTTTTNGNILDQSYFTLDKISDARTTRITSLQTRFPPLHYVTITALTAVILLVFLLETDRKVILFLDKFQIQSVWALLVGTVTAIYCIGIDLAQPFIGTYTVPAEQLLDDAEDILQELRLHTTTSGTTSTSTDTYATYAEVTRLPPSPTSFTRTTTTVPTTTAAPPPHLQEDFYSLGQVVESLPIMATPPTTIVEHPSRIASAPPPPPTRTNQNEPAADGGMSLYEEYMRGLNQ